MSRQSEGKDQRCNVVFSSAQVARSKAKVRGRRTEDRPLGTSMMRRAWHGIDRWSSARHRTVKISVAQQSIVSFRVVQLSMCGKARRRVQGMVGFGVVLRCGAKRSPPLYC